MEPTSISRDQVKPDFIIKNNKKLRKNHLASRAQTTGAKFRVKRTATISASDKENFRKCFKLELWNFWLNRSGNITIIGTKQAEYSFNRNKRALGPRIMSKNSFYNSEAYIVGPYLKQKFNIYQAAGVQPSTKPTDKDHFEFGFKQNRRRPISRSKKRKKPKSKSHKKRKFSFLNNYVNEQYNELKRKESQNEFLKLKLYQEIGIPPLPKAEERQAATIDRRNSTRDTSVKARPKE